MATVRTIAAADCERLVPLLNTYQPARDPAFWPDRMHHWWDANPAFDGSWSRGWCVEDEGRIVGVFASIPRYEQTPSGVVRSVNGSTWVVLPEFRRYSLALLRGLLDDTPVIQFNTTPGDVALKILETVRFVPFPGQQRRDESLLILDAAAVLSSLVNRPAAPIASFAGRIGQPLVDGWNAMQQTRLGARRGVRGFVIKSAGEIGAEFDRLWETARARYGFTAVRTAAVLQWYVFGNRHIAKTLVACRDVSGALVGYCILTRRVNPSLHLLACTDVLLASEDAASVAAVVSAAGKVAAEQGAAAVAFRHYSAGLSSAFRGLGLPRRTVHDRRELYWLPRGTTISPVSENSYLTEMHGDRWL